LPPEPTLGLRRSPFFPFLEFRQLTFFSLSTTDTTYTVATAGEEGFLSILPVYLDHILYPTITDAGFVTEVHNINGKGEDSGVVR
jgi:Zn-dependent M16 (insulinase) family peptidase